MKFLRGFRTKIFSAALSALGVAQTAGVLDLSTEKLIGLAASLLGGTGWFLRDAVGARRREYEPPGIKPGGSTAPAVALLAFALLVTTGCAASPLSSFRTLPWQGDLQAVFLKMDCVAGDDCVVHILDVIDGSSASGYEEKDVLVKSVDLRRQLRSVERGNHIEIHLETPDGNAVMRSFEHHGNPPPGWAKALASYGVEKEEAGR